MNPLTFLYLFYQYPFNTTLEKKMAVNEFCQFNLTFEINLV